MIDYRIGDVREVMASIPDGTISLIATSPPFLALRSYLPADHESKGDEIGSEADPAAFLDTLLALTAEWGRVLAPWGSIAIELGDTYSGSGGAGGDYNEGGLRDGQNAFVGSSSAERRTTETKRTRVQYDGHDQPIRDLHGKVQGGGAGWPRAKSLALIPQLYAVALAYGINPLTGAPSPAGRWLVRNVIVWHRPNPAVGALGDKYRPSTSYIVVATRSAKRWFDLSAVRQPPKNGAVAGDQGGSSTGYRGVTEGGTREGRNLVSDPAGAPPLDAWFDEYDYHDTWTLTTQPSSLAHYAMWPAKLAERLILSMCPREVCRVCGEPRRRVERNLRVTDGNFMRGHALARSDTNGRTFASNADTTYETLGWTDCGCQCPTCGGRNGDAPYHSASNSGAVAWSPCRPLPPRPSPRPLRRHRHDPCRRRPPRPRRHRDRHRRTQPRHLPGQVRRGQKVTVRHPGADARPGGAGPVIADIPTVWLERCLEVMDSDPATAPESVGIPCGVSRPEYGPAIRELACNACGATWAGIIGDPCWWCQRSREIQLDYQADLLLTPPDVDPDDERYEARMTGWAERLAVGVAAKIITADQARNAGRSIDRRRTA